MADTFFIEGLNTLPEQVQLNKEDIKKLSDSNTTQTEQLQALTTKVDTNTANIATNTSNIATNNTNIDNLSKKVYDNGSLSFRLGTESEPSIQVAFFRDSRYPNRDLSIQYATSSPKNRWMIQCNPDDDVYFNFAHINHATVSALYFWNSGYITGFSDSDVDDNHQGLTAHAINQNYLKKTDASNTYLTKTDASNTYVTKQDYEERIDTGDITLTQNGFDKISAMTEDVGTTITLTHTTDFTEHIQVTNTRELILNVYYNGDPIYKNIHLVPNQTIDDYTAVQEGTENWYTGHAILILPSQDYGYFAVSYQNGNYSQLILTLIAHY